MRKVWRLVATSIVVVAAIVLTERRTFMPSARLAECLLLLALLAVASWAAAGRLRNALVVACSLLAGLSVLEAVALATDRVPPPPVANDFGLARGRPFVGWGPTRPGVFRSTKVASNGHTIFDTHVTIDEALNRKTVPSAGGHPIVFFGDSWIYGDGVGDGDTLPQAFADLNRGRIPVLNLAFAGWSPAQNLIALQRGLTKPPIATPRHFVLFSAAFHVERTACKALYAVSAAPRYVLDGGEPRYVGPCAGRGFLTPVVQVAKRFALYKLIAPVFARPTRRDVETYLKIVETFVVTAKRDDAVDTTVLFAHLGENYLKGSGYTEADVIDALRKAGIDVLVYALPDDPAHQIQGDGHPTAIAYQAMARELEAHLRDVDPKALVPPDDEAQAR